MPSVLSPARPAGALAARLCLLFSFAAPSAAQEAGDVVRVNTDLVQTDVSVFDRQGRFVEGLTREQFELKVDGHSVPLAFFEGAAAGPHAQPARDGAARTRRVAIFLDDLHLSAASVEHLRKALAQLVEEGVRPGEEVAFVTASGQIGFLQQFTNHKGVMRAALARLRHRPPPARDTENPPMTEYVALRIAQGDREALNFYTNELLRSTQFQYSLPKYGGKGPGFLVGSEPEQIARVVAQRAETILAQTTADASATLAALENFLRAAEQTPGRKLVLFVSDGFFMYDRGEGLARQVQRVTDAAARAGASIYAADARSFTGQGADARMRVDALGRAEKFSGDELNASRAALATLAEHTGGRALLDARGFDAALGAAAAESARYYVLAWRPEAGGLRPEEFRQVEVKVAGRPDLLVRVHRGYLSGGAKAQAETLKAAGGRRASAPRGELPTRLAVNFLDTPAGGAVLTASTQIRLDADNFGGERETASVALAGAVFNEQGRSVSSFQKRLSVAAPAAGGTADSAVIFNHRAPLAPGLYQVRVAAHDEKTGRAGRASEWIEIPDLSAGRLALSSLHLNGEQVAAGANDSAAPVQFSVERRFRRSSSLSFLVVAYNAAGGQLPPELTAEIRVMREGQPALLIPTQKVPADALRDPRRVPFGGSFPLRSLRPGRYLLRVVITNVRTRASAVQEIDFEVE